MWVYLHLAVSLVNVQFDSFRKQKQKCTSYDLHRNVPYGKIQTKEEPIRMLGFIPKLPCHVIKSVTILISTQHYKTKMTEK